MSIKVLLVAIQLPKVSDDEVQGSLEELQRLVTTLGYHVVSQTSQRRSSDRSANVVGEGKLQELAEWTGGTGRIAPMVVKKKHKAALRFNQSKEEVEEIEKEFSEVVATLRLKLISYFETDMVDQDILVPYTVQRTVGEIRSKMRVLIES